MEINFKDLKEIEQIAKHKSNVRDFSIIKYPIRLPRSITDFNSNRDPFKVEPLLSLEIKAVSHRLWRLNLNQNIIFFEV